jgi:flagellin
MSLNISTNTSALRAGSQLAINQSKLQRSFDRLASGKKLSSPVDNPGGLAVSMKLSAAVNRLSGAQSNVQNAISFLEVQDGMLDSVGRIIDRMSELKGLASQDPMKSEQDRASYNNEFKDLQIQLYDISQMKFNGVSMFANYSKEKGAAADEALFNGASPNLNRDNTLTIFTSADGAAGSKVSVNKSLLLSALTIKMDRSLAGSTDAVGTSGWVQVSGDQKTNAAYSPDDDTKWVTFASTTTSGTLALDEISVGVITQVLENIAFLRAQNGGTASRLAFNAESLVTQKTNMRAALGRMVDVDIAEETTNLAKYSVLSQASASILAQANANTEIALMLLR